MEIHGIGPCVFIDTPGFDDCGEIGILRVSQTDRAIEKTDIGIMLFCDNVSEIEKEWAEKLRKNGTPIIAVINKIDVLKNLEEIKNSIERELNLSPVLVSALNRYGIKEIQNKLIGCLPEDYDNESLTGNLAGIGDTVLLVMPQDIQAPKGRLILPQVQVIRELLDKKCIITCITTDMIDSALKELKNAPKLIITDSQVFKTVYEKKPNESKLTSFSILMAGNKGDINYFSESAKAISTLTESSKVLIAEACTHAPLTEDIGREKIPRLLRQRIGSNLQINIVSGTDFPEDLSSYDLIIHCGGCMFNRKFMLSRISKAIEYNVPMTNYGVAIAYLSGILEKVDLP